ncbi:MULTISPECIES: ATP-binding SpoIIE family protein phosphatase [Streptomyces]|uniref:protein-serine/threonine phosphatase n=1 Tax=Streptomyces viridochromogenes TaxID=1938 RepID=A0A0L8JK38_STRVR|nr:MULTISPECIES: ATP-binding SpoIIE family protein phosphatase [Streptomyces]KOG14005.1 phosphatase [Streptomyces viridochromogenes]
MGTDAEAFLRRLAQELRPQSSRSVEVILERVSEKLPELWEHEDLAAIVLTDTAAHVTAFLDVLEHGLDASQADAPDGALELAGLFARRGLSLSSLLRAYRIGQLSFLQLLQTEAPRLTDDAELLNAAAMRMTEAAFTYVDRSSEQVVGAYHEERDRRLRRHLVVSSEAGRRIGSTLDIVRTAEELAAVGIEDFADAVTVDLLESALHEDGESEPPGAEPLLRRVAQLPSTETGFPVAAGRTHRCPPRSRPARTLATGTSCLAQEEGFSPWWPPASDDDVSLSVLLLPLQARGSTLGLVQFVRGSTTDPFDTDGLHLAQEIAARAAVSMDNARRYTHERLTSLTLQRSLLPRHTAEQSAVRTASRYLPSGSRGGVGGDWYDVIPLSGARVALVVGDVVGRGLHAAATMGRLRTAVRAFAAIDLMPDELLTHLDDVVIRMQSEEGRGNGELSATCLYAVYDPVSRTCSLASAGHVPPITSAPADLTDVLIGPPLGLGGLPFETTQLTLPEGSLSALYTDGLIQSRTRDVDTARAALSDILAGSPTAPVEEVCDRLFSTLLPDRPPDDVALLVARTRVLDPNHVATLDLPSDPAAVAKGRAFASKQLDTWDLDELGFTTELVVSELVTNAIRYGKPPVRLRLILRTTLTCEVFDASSTAPHLRHARDFDEGGRGLLLVAQLTDRWGARHSREGKVIWAEQKLPVREPHVDERSQASTSR